MDDVKILFTQVVSTFSQAADKRKQIIDHLRTVIAANSEFLQKLRSLAETKVFSARKIGTGSIKKKLEEALKKAKEEVKNPDDDWNKIVKLNETISQVLYNRKSRIFNF